MSTGALPLFIVMSFFSGLLEIGVVLWGVAESNDDFSLPFALAFAYQVGALVIAIKVGDYAWKAVAGTSVLAASTLYGNVMGAFDGTLATCVTVVLCSAAINLTRMRLGKAHISTTIKRCARVSGFLAAPMMMITGAPALVIMIASATCLAISLRSRPTNALAPPAVPGATDPILGTALVTHQMHYFSYCTVIMVMLLQSYSPLLGVIFFIAGWASYIATPHLLRPQWSPGSAAFVGHVFLPLVLIALWYAPAGHSLWIVLWVATGFLGGTVVDLTRLAQTRGMNEGQLVPLEGLGHCLGAGMALLMIASGHGTAVLFIAAAFFAAVTAVFVGAALPFHSRSREGQL